MKEIPLTRGFRALVDDGDYEALSQHTWCVTILMAPRRLAAAMRKEGCRSILMHREIMAAPGGVQVDHIHHPDLEAKVIDNRRGNLRLASQSQNLGNARKLTGGTSLFKGVWFNKVRNKWYAGIAVSGKRQHLGSFTVEAYAALTYDLAAVRLFGDFALTNFPVPGSTNWIFGPTEPPELTAPEGKE